MKLIQRTLVLLTAITIVCFGSVPSSVAQQRPYRNTDTYVKQLIQRLETRTNRFSNLLPNALDRSRIDGTNREDQVNTLVTNFKHATNLLKDRFNNHQSTMLDAQTVLQEGARIDRFMGNHRLDNVTERAWVQVRTQLDGLANAYAVARNWRTMQWPTPTTDPSTSSYDSMFTGTFRLNTVRSDNPRTVANNATSNLSARDRRSVYDNLINRLTPPEMIAVERHRNSVTLASTRTPQVTFDVDGTERVESYPDGRRSNVRAEFTGGKLQVVSNGNKVNDFTATFVPVDNGRQLLVTREIYAERLAHPVLVQSYYDRTADVAQWTVYNGRPIYTGGASTNFVVPDGTQVVAVLDRSLSTQYAHDNDPFTMRVISPAAYAGARLDGHITGVSRGGRVTGRSEITFDFDRITLRNGRTYDFVGALDNVQTHNGENTSVDNEGAVREGDKRTNTTLERTGIGAAIGALIGAVTGGGQGAAIGAGVGAGAGAGSVYVQGRDDLELASGTNFTIRASSPVTLSRDNRQ